MLPYAAEYAVQATDMIIVLPFGLATGQPEARARRVFFMSRAKPRPKTIMIMLFP